MNDPNGVCRIDGVYHVFFQYNPGATTHGDVHWGHARSIDLLTWTYSAVALAPRPGGIDAAGCWSGCVVDDDGVPTAVYTAVPDHAGNAGVALARSDRSLVEWRQGGAFLAGTPADSAIDEVRDPFVFSHRGHRYAVQGAGARHGRPQLLLYGCDDLEHWSELGPLLTDDDPVAAEVAAANLWECPNLARIDGRWVLLVSLWRGREETHELAGVRYLIGDLMPAGAGLRFVAESGGTVDEGPTFYAPQLLATPDRTLLWGWAWELGRTDQEVEDAGWAGMLTFPRELFVADGQLRSRPAAELTGLRGEPLLLEPGGSVEAPAFEIVAGGSVQLRLGEVVVAAAVGTATDPVRILVDGSIIETYAGGSAHTSRAYPTAADHWVVEGDATVYPLGLAGSRPSLG